MLGRFTSRRIRIVRYFVGRDSNAAHRYCPLVSRKYELDAPRFVSALVEDRKVMPHHCSFTAHDQTHGDAFGFVVMCAMEQIDRTKASAES